MFEVSRKFVRKNHFKTFLTVLVVVLFFFLQENRNLNWYELLISVLTGVLLGIWLLAYLYKYILDPWDNWITKKFEG